MDLESRTMSSSGNILKTKTENNVSQNLNYINAKTIYQLKNIMFSDEKVGVRILTKKIDDKKRIFYITIAPSITFYELFCRLESAYKKEHWVQYVFF